MEGFREKLKRLKEQRKQTSHSNFKAVLEENQQAKRPANWEKKLERNQKRLEMEEEKQKAEDAGEDYELKRGLNYRAEQLEAWDKFRSKKRRSGDNYLDFEEATKRQYERSVSQLKPNVDEYESLRQELGDEKFYLKGGEDSKFIPKNVLIKDSKQGIERMVEDTRKQIEIRSKRSRRRRFDDEADVDYINERNMKFNKKLERFYGSYTEEIKQNFERGTAM